MYSADMKSVRVAAWIAVVTIVMLVLSVACSADSAREQYIQTASAHNLMKQQTATANATREANWELQEEPKQTPRPTLTSVPEIDDVSRKLATVSGRNDQTTRQRFKFLISELVGKCPDISSLSRAGDHLVIAHNQLDEAGLSGEERLVDVSNNLHFIVKSVDSFADSSNVSMPKCLELFAAYTTLRYQGWSAREAREGVVDVTVELYSIGR